MKKNIKCVRLVAALGLSLSLIAATQSNSAVRPAEFQDPATQAGKPFDQKQKLADLRQQIAGQERKPAEQVYKNIQDYKGVPAGGLLRGMEFYTRALGVDCAHCHIIDEFERDDKPTKQIAREMSALVDSIGESLKKIKNLKSERPGISCASCHHGQVKPAISMSTPFRPPWIHDENS